MTEERSRTIAELADKLLATENLSAEEMVYLATLILANCLGTMRQQRKGE